MQDRNNTIAGWVLFAGIIALGASIVSGEMFQGERPEEMGFPIEGAVVESAGAAAVAPIELRMQTAEEAKGEQVFKKCTACHNADKGGANALGPNLWGVLGKPHGHVAGFAYSDALKGIAGNWDFKSLDEWLASPKKYAHMARTRRELCSEVRSELLRAVCGHSWRTPILINAFPY